jgi:hypothetical protein
MQDQKLCRGRNYRRLRTKLSDIQGHPASCSERPQKEPAIVQQARKLGHILPFPCSLFCLAQNIGVRWEAASPDSGTKSQMSIYGKNRRRVIQAIQDEITGKERDEEIAEVILGTFQAQARRKGFPESIVAEATLEQLQTMIYGSGHREMESGSEELVAARLVLAGTAASGVFLQD